MKSKVKVTHRGWAGHFCGSRNCLFRLNTLIEMDGKEGYVVSSVGNYMVRNDSEPEILGADGRTFETMVFYSIADGEFIEADTGRGEINVCGYKEELAANDGHFEMVDKYVKAIQS